MPPARKPPQRAPDKHSRIPRPAVDRVTARRAAVAPGPEQHGLGPGPARVGAARLGSARVGAAAQLLPGGGGAGYSSAAMARAWSTSGPGSGTKIVRR